MRHRAQQPDHMRRIGLLTNVALDDQDNNARIAGFQQRLKQLGWTDGHNVRIDYRFAGGNLENFPKYAAELVALAPDVIVASGNALPAMLQATRTVPVVFPSVLQTAIRPVDVRKVPASTNLYAR